MKYVFSIFLLVLGFVLIARTYAFVQFFGHLDWAERRLGPGGTYAAWRIIAVICFIGAFAVIRYSSLFGL